MVLTWRPHFKGTFQANTTRTVLVKDVAGLNLSYFTAPSGWKPVTREKAKPPALIRIELLSRDGRQWPPLVVAPGVDLVPAVAK